MATLIGRASLSSATVCGRVHSAWYDSNSFGCGLPGGSSTVNVIFRRRCCVEVLLLRTMSPTVNWRICLALRSKLGLNVRQALIDVLLLYVSCDACRRVPFSTYIGGIDCCILCSSALFATAWAIFRIHDSTQVSSGSLLCLCDFAYSSRRLMVEWKYLSIANVGWYYAATLQPQFSCAALLVRLFADGIWVLCLNWSQIKRVFLWKRWRELLANVAEGYFWGSIRFVPVVLFHCGYACCRNFRRRDHSCQLQEIVCHLYF